MTTPVNRPAELPGRVARWKARRSERVAQRAAAGRLAPAARWTLGLTGAAALGAGAVAVFITQVEAGPVALVTVGAVLLIIAVMGRRITSLSLVDGGMAFEERVERQLSQADTPEQALQVATAATTVAPEVQKNKHISSMSHVAYEEVVADRLISAFGTSVVDPRRDRRRASRPPYDVLLTREGKRVGVEILFGDPSRTVDRRRVEERVLRAFTEPDLDAFIVVCNQREPSHSLLERVSDLVPQGKGFQYVRWADDTDTPALRRVIEEQL
ncbi:MULTISPECIES: hypothetical protein [Streptomyces]|uniref:hypothetical protein n=1 Tax=Streptomyces TaxID=1883 RepID=UPI00103CBBD1|nr:MULTISPECIES: hypothetical protein [Streptomyces]MBT3076571.1 hypothetical protein [Streptomyces sp. COG21]MBT3078913.1 hypothetical protein [Streptomyces sp. COG20]MBT3087783.1 hypothetical protein [Streptomyces sp. CYG21]MBT3096510.1 hypothetical protein [Streptomyces sp. CBG30]MBT3096513.1 hypothetical protein [Streptomyces sp. CBG30]